MTATLAELQNYLRQRRATGRSTPQDNTDAYKAYFADHSNNALARAQQDLASRRTDIEERQNAERLSQSNRELQIAEREERANEKALEEQGRLQTLQFAVPDLFDDRKKTDGSGGETDVQGSSDGTTSPGAKAVLGSLGNAAEAAVAGGIIGGPVGAKTAAIASLGHSLSKGFIAAIKGLFAPPDDESTDLGLDLSGLSGLFGFDEGFDDSSNTGISFDDDTSSFSVDVSQKGWDTGLDMGGGNSGGGVGSDHGGIGGR